MSNAGHVSGKVAVVTGGAHGMGAAHVRAWRAKVRSSLRPTQSTTSEPPWPSSCSRREETSLTTTTMSPAAPGGKPWWRASSRRTARSTCSSATPACRSDRWESKPTIANGTCGNEAGVHESVFGQRRKAAGAMLEYANPILSATETGSGRIRTFSWQCLAVSSDAVALSLIAASQRGHRCLDTPRYACRELEPHHSVSLLILKPGVRKTSLSWSPVTESNRRPSPYHACRFRPAVSGWVGLPQVGRIAVSEHVALRLPLPGVVVTRFVTGFMPIPRRAALSRFLAARRVGLQRGKDESLRAAD